MAGCGETSWVKFLLLLYVISTQQHLLSQIQHLDEDADYLLDGALDDAALDSALESSSEVKRAVSAFRSAQNSASTQR